MALDISTASTKLERSLRDSDPRNLVRRLADHLLCSQPDPFTGVGFFCGLLLFVTEFSLQINGLRYNGNFRETAPIKLRATYP
jgi:hypothetical protein